MKKHLGMVLCLALVLSISTPVLAAETVITEQELAAAYLAGHNIMVGDQNGALHLESKLTRAELAAVLCRLCVNQRHVEADRELYEEKCVFSDVPAWSRVYVGWCAFSGLMGGYGGGRFGGYDPVTNAAACTTVLRYLGYSETPWDYDTACETAFRLGLTDETLAPGSVITRGELAVMIYRALDGRKLPEAHEDRQSLTRNEDGSLNLPSDGSQYIPQAGDVIRCDDGTNYTITDVSAYEKALKKYVAGYRYVGTVCMVDLKGVFVSLDGGIDCLCTYPKRGRPPRGARATVRILGINHENNRIWGVITHMSTTR